MRSSPLTGPGWPEADADRPTPPWDPDPGRRPAPGRGQVRTPGTETEAAGKQAARVGAVRTEQARADKG